MSAAAREDISIESGSALAQVAAELEKRHQGVIGCIAYGSCLRGGDPFDGLSDFYLLVDGYGKAHGTGLAALFNWMLPPNVYYAEVPLDEGLARVKYSLLSLAGLERGCKRRFESYLWGRFAQPVGLHAFSRAAHGERVLEALGSAAARLIKETLPLMEGDFTSRDLWTCGLAKSYATELRAEKAGRVAQIFEYAPQHYQRLTARILQEMAEVAQIDDDRWSVHVSTNVRILGRGKWMLRSLLGKCLSLARLFKAYFTFRDGIGYLVWKLSRHSGRVIEVPPRVRRFPLIFGLPFFARLYRQGVFK